MRSGANRQCSIDGCDRRAVARHLCNPHYLKAQRTGQLAGHALQQERPPPKLCSWDGCSRVVEKRSLCSTHYQTWRKANPDKVHKRPTNTVCSIEGCDRPTKSRGWCKNHHQIWLRTGEPELKAFIDPGCSIEGCSGAHYGRGWCGHHWRRFNKYGDPLAPRGRRDYGERVPCAVADCGEVAEARGWCKSHYQRWRRYGDPLGVRKPWEPSHCSVDDCTSDVRSLGVCQKHYQRFRRHGDVNAVKRQPTRFGALTVCIEDGCDRKVHARGRCSKHYNLWNLSDNYVPAEPQTGMPCTVENCVNDSFASRLCATHYYRRRKYGDVLDHLPVGWMIKPPPPCSVEGCELQQADRTVCIVHYGPKVGWTLDDPSYSTTTDTSDWLAVISGDPCGYCGGPMEHIDHIHPRSQGGPDHWTNFAPTCQWCNQAKRVDSVLGFMLKRLGEGDDGALRVSTGGPVGAAEPSRPLAS